MKTAIKKGTIKNPVVHLDPTLDKKYEGKVIAPEKLKKLNEELSTYGIPSFMKKP